MLRLGSMLCALLMIGMAVPGAARSAGPAPKRITIPKVEHPGVWHPTGDAMQFPLWPATMTLAKPDSGDHPEATGNGSPLVGGRPWHWASYITRPTLTLYRPRGQNTGAAMLVVPGGGFYAVATDLEGTEICDWVTRQGMTCAMLKYRTPQVWPTKDGRQQRPKVLLGLQDAERAMGLLRAQAARYGIDPHRIGAIGFSAGAYLVIDLSNRRGRSYPPVDATDAQSARPDFAIIAYTARVLDNSRGKNDLALQPWVKIDPHAPPTLIIHAMNDPTDNVRQAMAYALALNDAGVPVDLRLYAKGGHAFGLRPTDDPVTREWPGEAQQWLHDIGILRRLHR